MISFEVWINGEKICLAGVGDYGVLSAHVTWSHGRPERRIKSMKSAVDDEVKPHNPWIAVGGMVNNEHVRWTHYPHTVKVGDEVTFKIIESDIADEPIERKPAAYWEETKNQRYERYRALKREFEGEESAAGLKEMDVEEAKRIRTRLYLEYREEFDPES